MSETLYFSKMHGLGNDFVVIDTISQVCPELTLGQRQFLADHHRGIGCDQLLLVEKATQAGVDFKYRIFNQDGGEVEQCGNGARCFARFVFDKGLTNKHQIVVETNSGIISLSLTDDSNVTVDMGVPKFEPIDIPLLAEQKAQSYQIDLNDEQLVSLAAVSMGNPHAVIQVDDIELAPVNTLGPVIENHSDFPERVNVGFMQVIEPAQLSLRVFERGVGETQACGTGACAAVVTGIQQGLLSNQVTVQLLGGQLHIEWQGGNEPVFMTGPATHVFDGEIAWATINNL